MDKITKNPTNAKLTDSPRTSNTDSQIEKYRIEISKKSESDFINTRKLTIQSTVKNEPPPESNEIDKQISDLESLIKRLQDEIVEMSANKSSLLPSEDLTELEDLTDDPTDDSTVNTTEDKPFENEEESHEANTTVDVIDTAGTTSHVYPVMLKDVGLNLDDQSEQFADKVSELVNYKGEEPVDQMPETYSSIRKNFDVLLGEEMLDDEDPTERRVAHENYHLNKLIGELKTEISEKLESLKDVFDGEQLNNSKENINLSPEENNENLEDMGD